MLKKAKDYFRTRNSWRDIAEDRCERLVEKNQEVAALKRQVDSVTDAKTILEHQLKTTRDKLEEEQRRTIQLLQPTGGKEYSGTD